MSELQACFIRDDFLIKLNYCKNQVNSKFKQISDNLLTRQNQLLSELDGIENKYSESRNAENELKQTEKFRNEQNKGLQDSKVPLSVISRIKQMIKNIDVDITDLRQKLVTFTNIDIELDTDSINTLIDKLGSVILTEDGEYNLRVDYITDTCDIDPCESYNPFNKNICNNTTVCTDALRNKKREQDNVVCNNSPIEDVASIPEMGISDSQSSSYKQSMVQHNTPFNLNKNECPVDSSPDRLLVLRNQKSSILPASATQLNNEVNSKHQSVNFDQSSKQTPNVNISPRPKSFSSKDTAPNQDVNDKSLPGNAACSNSSQQKNSESEDNKRENTKYETYGTYEILSPQRISTDLDSQVYLKYREATDDDDENSKAANKDSPQPSSETSIERSDSKQSSKASERSANTYSRTNSTASGNEDNLNNAPNSNFTISSCNDEDMNTQDSETGATPETETVIITGGINRKEKQKKTLGKIISRKILPTMPKFL